MQQCYHQTCDYAKNPELSPENLYFLAKTTQALVLAVAELSGGLEKCDLTPFKNVKKPEKTSPPKNKWTEPANSNEVLNSDLPRTQTPGMPHKQLNWLHNISGCVQK